MLAPADGSEPYACGEGCPAHQGDKATLWVSLGTIPDVAGQSADAARSTLQGMNLVVAEDQTEASDTVPAGQVIRLIRPDDGWLKPGETVTLVVSSGPPLFAIPDLSGKTLAQARDAAAAAGFTIDVRRVLGWRPRPVHEGGVPDRRPAAR